MSMSISINTVGGLMRPRGFNGQTSRLTETIIDSLVSSDPVDIQFGSLVGRDPAQPKCLRTAHYSDELLGPVHRDPVPAPANSDGTVTFKQYASVPFMRLGYMNLTPIENVNAGDGLVAVFDGSSRLFTGFSSTATPIDGNRRLVKGIKWETTTAANASEPGEVSCGFNQAVNYITY
jgi:hypothetical protein